MPSIPIQDLLAKLPTAELWATLNNFLAPMLQMLPDTRLRRVLPLAVAGIIASQSPLVTRISQPNPSPNSKLWATAKRIYRLLSNKRVSARDFTHGLYRLAQSIVASENPAYLVVAVDPLQFEKPYTRKLEGVSTVHKSTPPDLHGQPRLTRGYPAITATVVNTRVPATTYAHWFSYKTGDFISQNIEIRHALRMTRSLFPKRRLRFVGDSGLDNARIFNWVNQLGGEFVIRASHLERWVEVYNPRLRRWEREHLRDIVDTLPWEASWEVAFTHAGYDRLAKLQIGWIRIRLTEPSEESARLELWVVVAHDGELNRTLVLLTNVEISGEQIARQVYGDWRLRGRVEDGYRFDQEQGLDIEDVRLRSLERMEEMFVLVLAAAEFVSHISTQWPPEAVEWLRELGGKLGLGIDRDGLYILLAGLRSVGQTVATLKFLADHPFPHDAFF